MTELGLFSVCMGIATGAVGHAIGAEIDGSLGLGAAVTGCIVLILGGLTES